MFIRKIVFLILIFPSLLLSQQIKKEIGETYEKENIAVFEIQGTSSGYGEEVGAKMTALIENSLTRMNRFNIVDRKNLDKYLKEMELQLTGITEKQVIEIFNYIRQDDPRIPLITSSDAHYTEHIGRRAFLLDTGDEVLDMKNGYIDIEVIRRALQRRAR